MKTRKIIYVSGTRADYGLMRELLTKLDHSEFFDFSICVTGMHLDLLYGNTYKEIEADKFRICGTIPVNVDQASHVAMAQSIGYQLIGMTEVFERESPDLILLLGDRGEMLAAAIAAVHLNIPIVHLHGGERSGTVDEMIRHAISKLSHYHFVATDASKERLIKMGEIKDNVMVVGAPGLDEIKIHNGCTREQFVCRYQLTNKRVALLIFHPVVQEYGHLKTQFHSLMRAVLAVNLQVICLEPNSDAGGQLIREVLREYENHHDVRIIKHLLRSDYIDCLMNVDVMIGNSSSGIIEAASFNLAVVNVGSRQNLRECGDNVIHVSASFDSILIGVQEALQRPPKTYKNIYGDGETSLRCYELLKNIKLEPNILNKCNAY
jgi:GDP/UDP-N,N'-diacetylbacillosamine 2-epimerase (hydrolysing)